MSHPVRIYDDTYREVQGVSRLLGRTPGELLARAWEQFKDSPEFKERFYAAQKVLATGDVDAVTERLAAQADYWAEQAAEEVRGLRSQ